jgi:hypothetical protein
MTVPIMTPKSFWECPNCDFKDVTFVAGPHTRYHNCRGMKGLSVPMVPFGTKAKIVAVEREDYVGKELVQKDGDDRPIMSIVTTRDEGQDCTVLAPTATGNRG